LQEIKNISVRLQIIEASVGVAKPRHCLAFDEVRDQYFWFRFGWDNKNLSSILLFIFV